MTPKERMLKLADFLEQLHLKQIPGMSPERFNLTLWRTERVKTTPCGTVACAVGHIEDAMPEEGLRFLPQGKTTWGGIVMFPSYRGKVDWDAVTEFFDIGYSEAVHLFGGASYDSNTEIIPVVQRLREYAAKKGE